MDGATPSARIGAVGDGSMADGRSSESEGVLDGVDARPVEVEQVESCASRENDARHCSARAHEHVIAPIGDIAEELAQPASELPDRYQSCHG